MSETGPQVSAGLSLRERKLAGLHMTPVIDRVTKFLLPPQTDKVEIAELISFDQLSVRSFELTNDYRTAATVRGGGKVSHRKGSSHTDLMQEGADAAGKIFLGGSIMQAKKMLEMVGKKSGLVWHDGKAKFRAGLRLGDKEIGEAVYTVIKVNSLKPEHDPNLPDFVRTAEKSPEGIYRRPALVTGASIDLDLRDLPTNKDGLVVIHFRQNMNVAHLSRDGAQDVIITSLFSVRTKEAEKITKESNGRLELNLGPVTYEVIRGTETKLD